MKKPNKN